MLARIVFEDSLEHTSDATVLPCGVAFDELIRNDTIGSRYELDHSAVTAEINTIHQASRSSDDWGVSG